MEMGKYIEKSGTGVKELSEIEAKFFLAKFMNLTRRSGDPWLRSLNDEILHQVEGNVERRKAFEIKDLDTFNGFRSRDYTKEE